MNKPCCQSGLCMLFVCCSLYTAASSLAQSPQRLPPDDALRDPMLALLQQMVAEDPSRADTWRLIGRVYRKQDRISDAVGAFRRTLALQPDNIAAHSDLGELFEQIGERRGAAFHYDQVMRLGPNSDYAKRLVERGVRPAPRMAPDPFARSVPMPNHIGQNGDGRDQAEDNSDDSDFAAQAAYEIQTFDGGDELERRLFQMESDLAEDPNRLRAFIEFGALYNTNISLTPISRELTGSEVASAQGFFNPDVEWIAFNNETWRAGPLARGYFTVNEEQFQYLDLASFQPGLFFEHDLPTWEDWQFIGRVDYVYSIDLLDGDRFGDRHGLSSSLTAISPDCDVIYAYFNVSYSDFLDEGDDPSVDSLDGPSITAGISRFFTTDWSFAPTWSLGADIDSAITEGADYRYQAATLHGDITFQLRPRLTFTPRAGIGYRYYGDYTGPVSRDEFTWRAGGRLKWQWTDNLAISAVVGHDRFASDNDEFDTERTEAGIVFTVTR